VRIHDNTVATHLFHIAQEAVQNATKHGRAKLVTIELSSDEENIALRVEDDGAGMPDKLPATGMGLRIMSHRAQMIGGSLELKRHPGGGTVVECLVRVPERKETVYGQV
jgi:signal transduction histidine kinase